MDGANEAHAGQRADEACAGAGVSEDWRHGSFPPVFRVLVQRNQREIT